MRIMGGAAAGVVAIALAGVALAGCSAGANTASTSAPAGGFAQVNRAPAAPAPANAGGADSNAAGGSATGSGGGAAPQPAKGPLPAANQVPAAGRQVIRSATIGLRVSDVAGAAARVRAVAIGAGGFTASEDTESDHADFVLQVPAASLDSVVDRLATIGTQTDRTQQAQDVTDQLVDVRSRLATQQASVDRVRALLDRATTIGDIVSLEDELTKREADLESLEQRQAELSGQVALSAVTVHLSEQRAVAPPAPPKSGGFVGALGNGWHAFGAVLNGALVVLGATLPFVVVVGIPATWWLLRRRRRGTVAPPPATPTPEAD